MASKPYFRLTKSILGKKRKEKICCAQQTNVEKYAVPNWGENDIVYHYVEKHFCSTQ